jgi:hypothetical protein
MTLVD